MQLIILTKLALFALFHKDISIAPSIVSERLTIAAQSQSYQMPYRSNFSLNKPNSNIQQAVIVVHGILKDVNSVFQSIVSDIPKSQKNNVMVVAPQYLTVADVKDYKLPHSTLAWGFEAWDDGEDAKTVNDKNIPITSFTALTDLIEKLEDQNNFPNLKEIKIVGFSAGAQFVQRYAVLSDGQQQYSNLQYFVASPSSYVYLDNRRPDLKQHTFSLPTAQQLSHCPTYNDYKYGLLKLPTKISPQQLANDYSLQKITYLVGGDDDKRGIMLDKACQADLQGRERLQRAQLFYQSLVDLYSDSIKNTQKIYVIPGVSHDSKQMFASTQFKKILFS